MKHACANCDAITEFVQEPGGWACPKCGTIHPLWYPLGDEMLGMAYLTLKWYPWEDAGDRFRETLFAGEFSAAEDLCTKAIQKNHRQDLAWLYRGVIRTIRLPLTVEDCVKNMEGRDPFAPSLAAALNLQEDFLTCLELTPAAGLPLRRMILENITGMVVLYLWGAELYCLEEDPSHWKQFALNLKRLEDRREKLLPRRAPSRRDLDRKEFTLVQEQKQTLQFWQSELVQARIGTGKRIWQQEEAQHAPGTPPDPFHPSVVAALNLLTPDADEVAPERIRRTPVEMLQAITDSCTAGIAICNALEKAPPEDVALAGIPFQKDSFHAMRNAAEIELSSRAQP